MIDSWTNYQRAGVIVIIAIEAINTVGHGNYQPINTTIISAIISTTIINTIINTIIITIINTIIIRLYSNIRDQLQSKLSRIL